MIICTLIGERVDTRKCYVFLVVLWPDCSDSLWLERNTSRPLDGLAASYRAKLQAANPSPNPNPNPNPTAPSYR